MMAEKTKTDLRLITQLSLDNFLSFGPKSSPLALESLNVFIGPNGAGKSNVIEAVALLRATPRAGAESDVRRVLINGGGRRNGFGS